MSITSPLLSTDPRRLGSYVLLWRLGGGGMGVVYLGEAQDERLVAIKVIRPELADDSVFLARFRQEVEAASRVAGFCTARVIDADLDAERPWFATEYVDGPTLQQAVRRTRTCKQPDLRADLAIGPLTAERAGTGKLAYTVIVRNDGRTATPTFGVGFAVGDQAQPPQTVQPLAAGEQRALTFVAPRCDASEPVRVTLDPDLAVDEANEGNNTRTIACPLSG